jgi:NTP pyrophosphatase (non-canonical NTP hydrolase)
MRTKDITNEYVEFITEHSPDETLLRQLAEECMELGQACLKMIRANNKNEYVKKSYDDIYNNLVEEFGDVRNCMNVVESKLGLSHVDIYSRRLQKLERWRERLLLLEKHEE